MSRPAPVPHSAVVAEARASLPEHDHVAFDRLAGAVLSSPTAPLGPLLRAQLPGTAGVRWLRQEQLPPTTRPTQLSGPHWRSLFACWSAVQRAPGAGGPGGRKAGGRPSAHGHAPGAMAVPRWGQ